MKISAFLTAVLFAAGMAFAQSSGYDHNNKTNKGQGQETVEHTTKNTPSAKTRSTTVRTVGRVTTFESGKKLVVTTAKNKHRSFDLSAKDTTVNGAENVKPGEMVRVVQSKENGHTTINIEPYTSAHATHHKTSK